MAGLLAVLFAGAAGVAVAGAQETGEAAPKVAVNRTVAGEPAEMAPRPGAVYGHWGFDDSGIDPAARPGDSFFDYANGAWFSHAAIPAGQPRLSTFGALTDRTQTQILAIVTEAARSGASPDTDTGKIGALFKAYMDVARIERLDIAPIAADLAKIRDASTRTAIAVNSFGGSPFSIWVAEDEKDPTRHTLHVGQGGLGLPDRDYYLRDVFQDKKAAYREYAALLLGMAGWPDAQQRAAEVVAFETSIAEAGWSRSESRDRDETYNPLTIAELDVLAPDFPWGMWLSAFGLRGPRTVVVRQKSALPRLAKVFADTPVTTLQAWKAFRGIDQWAPYLSARFRTAYSDFHAKTLAGVTGGQPRSRAAVQLIGGLLGDAVGREYVARHFPPESKARMEELVGEVRRALRARIENVVWMTPATRARALEKLDLVTVQIGYPDKWRDYSKLVIDPADLVGNIRRARAFRWAADKTKLDRPVDQQEWSVTPQTVNAFYRATRNEIVFPAAILQPPFFDPNADMAINYGAIGGVIGHELTHAFDDQGRKSDGHGVLTDWWQPEDAATFKAQAAKLGAQYDAYTVAPGVNVKGGQTMGENIADLGGILLALDAYRASLHGAPAPVLDGTTGEQRVFLGWAQTRRAKFRVDALKRQTTSDTHAPDRFRVDGPFRNVDAWYDAFGVKPGDRLYLSPEQRVHIW